MDHLKKNISLLVLSKIGIYAIAGVRSGVGISVGRVLFIGVGD